VIDQVMWLSGGMARAQVPVWSWREAVNPCLSGAARASEPAHGGTWPDSARGVVQVYLWASGMQVSLVVSLSQMPRRVLGSRDTPVFESLGVLWFWCVL
jgi:hypothetical protein